MPTEFLDLNEKRTRDCPKSCRIGEGAFSKYPKEEIMQKVRNQIPFLPSKT